MKPTQPRKRSAMLGLGLLLASLTGCQTWPYDSSMTLPSGHYPQHRPQDIPKSPQYPYHRELALLEQEGTAEEPVIPGRIPRPAAVVPLP